MIGLISRYPVFFPAPEKHKEPGFLIIQAFEIKREMLNEIDVQSAPMLESCRCALAHAAPFRTDTRF
jgi:hypothetical protein